MSTFAYDPTDLDEEQLEELDGLSDEQLAAYFEDPIEPDPLAGYSHAVSPQLGRARPFPNARDRGITDLPGF
ncbi:hypothetical protein ACGFWE_13800 [Streptomyces sp. NPDC048523]|uniref:hypothetical protein n=1 Tax=Streptomyces sp. NPDC048523 TaxID=3365567 RepID=UPI00371D3286